MQQEQLADAVRALVQETGLSRAQIAQRAGLPSRTIGSWANGLVRRPRRWQDLLRFAAGAGLNEAQTNRLLRSAEYNDITTLRQAADPSDQDLFSNWQQTQAPHQIPRLDVQHVAGRDAERAQLAHRLRRGGQVCVVQGMGGVGKSTLATIVAHTAAPYFAGGVLWANLRHSDVESVLAGWGQALDIDLSVYTGTVGRAARLWSIFARQRLLIILDDVVDAAAIKPLLPSRHTECSVLVTTRRQSVANSLVANPDNLINLQPLLADDSVSILAATASPERVAAEPEAAAAIGELLGHLPLALTIVGRVCRVRRRSLERMRTRLQALHSRLDPLQIGPGEAVRDVFEETWTLLSAEEQDAFRALAIFGGRPFQPATFARVTDLTHDVAEDRLDTLYTLALLSIESEAPRRYRQHPLLAAFAYEKLERVAPAEIRFAAVVLEFVEQHADEYARLLAEWGHIKAAVETTHRHREDDMLLTFVRLLRPIWFARGLYSDARQAYAWSTVAVNDDAAAATIALDYGQACLEQSDYEQARHRLAYSLDRFTALGDDRGIADAHYHLARAAMDQDQLEAAGTHLQDAWRHYQQAEAAPGLANVLYRQGRIAYLRGQYDATDAFTLDSLKLLRQVGDARGELRSLNLLSMSAMEQKDEARAQHYCEQALALSEQLDDIPEQTACSYVLTNLLRMQGEFAAARRFGRKSLVGSREQGDRATEANVLVLLARVENDAFERAGDADLQQALQDAEHALTLYDEIAFEWGRAAGLITVGMLQRNLGDPAAARASWQEGRRLADVLSSQVLIGRLTDLLRSLPL